MRKLSALGTVAVVHFATVGIGFYLTGPDGKVSLSNLSALLLVMFALPAYLAVDEFVNTRLLAFLLVFNLCAWASFSAFLYRYGWIPNWPVLFFQELEIVLAMLLIWYAARNPLEFRTVVRWGTLCSALISLHYGVQEIERGDSFIISFGMDDKSQAAVLLCCQAFILVRYFGGWIDCLVAVGLIVMSFITLSRLPALFLPAIIVALLTRPRVGAPILLGSAAGAAAVVALAWGSIADLFKVFDRLSSVQAVASGEETTAHLLLIKSALQMKFTDWTAFLLGTGPGNFAEALTSFPIGRAQLESVDPALVNLARIGKAPMHSVPFSALLDFNILIFAAFVLLLFQVVRFVVIRKRPVELLFFASLLGASTFYSLHNKPYFFLLSVTIFILMAQEAGSLLPPGDHAKGGKQRN